MATERIERCGVTLCGVVATYFKDRATVKVVLTPKEAELLHYLMQRCGEVVSSLDILRDIWGYPKPEEIVTRTHEVHVGRLRKKLRELGSPNMIHTVAGVGYRFG